MGSVGIIYSKGAVLLYREKDLDGIPYGGLRLLHGALPSFGSLNRTVSRHFYGPLKLIHAEGAFPTRQGTYQVYLVKEATALRFPKTYEVRFLNKQEIANAFLEKPDREILRRFYALSFYYLGQVGKPYSEEESRKAEAYAACLEFFRQKEGLPAGEIALFRALMKQYAPVAQLAEAQDYFLTTYHCDLQRYLDRLRLQMAKGYYLK